jgi:hypothetical protein
MFITRVRETLHHSFGALGCVYRNVRVPLRNNTLSAFSDLTWVLDRVLQGAFPFAWGWLAASFLRSLVIAAFPPKLVDIGIRVCLSAGLVAGGTGHLVIALAVLILLLSFVTLVIPVAACAVSLLIAPATVPISVTTASTPTAEPVLIPAIVIELVLVAIITLIVSCLEARVKRAIITIAHARSAWMIEIILADIP